jgi:hypothetical protein
MAVTTATAIQLTEVDKRVMDYECPSIEAIIGGQKIAGILIDGGSGINVISMATCRQLGITKWEPCKFWLRMTNGSSVRLIGMIPDLEMVVQGQAFTISMVIMDLPHQDAYPILLGRPWLRSTQLKHDWPKNVLTFWRGGCKIRIHTTKGRIPDKATAPVYAEGVNMLEGLTEEEVDTFLQENPTMLPLYEIDVVKEAEPYQISYEAAIVKLGRAMETLERELVVSQGV